MNLHLFPLVLSLATTLHATGESPSTVRVFYFGNSLTESSHSEWHSELSKKAGRTWKTEAFIGAGCPGYTVAGLFNERPDALDYAIYNDQSKHSTDVNHDFGEVLEKTNPQAKLQ